MDVITYAMAKLYVDNILVGEIPLDIYANRTQMFYPNNPYGAIGVGNIDSITISGFYTAPTTATTIPDSNYSWFILHENNNEDALSAHQRAISNHANLLIYERTKIAGVWGSWIEIRDENGSIPVNSVKFDVSPIIPTNPGAMYWDVNNKTISIVTTEGTILQINEEAVTPMVNNTGSMVPDGTLVYWTEAVGASGKIRLGKFIADGTIENERIIGVTTHNIENGDIGLVVRTGMLNNLNTTGAPYGETWSDGDILYASPTIAGGFTKVKPNSPNSVTRMGIVVRAHQTTGILYIQQTKYPPIATETNDGLMSNEQVILLNELDTRRNMIKLINKTGANTVKGSIVSASLTTDLAFVLNTEQANAFGIVVDNGIADGQLAWIQTGGLAEVLLEDGTASTRGNFVFASTIDGRANATQQIPDGGTIPSINEHFNEIGHCLESKVAGTNVLCKIAVHFN